MTTVARTSGFNVGAEALQLSGVEASSHAKGRYRRDIDGLRAFAVLAVMFYHGFPNVFEGGYIGVDVFFVISGYLISSILFHEIDNGTFSFGLFYARRIRRIFPALVVCLIAVLAYGFIPLLPSELMQLGKHVFFGAAFLSNVATWSEAGYFGIAATLKPLLHLWSLGIEEQFYILWPAILWVAFRMKAATNRLVLILILASFCSNIYLSSVNIVDDFFLPISRFWELLAGAALALRRPSTVSIRAQSWISIAGSGALIVSVALFHPDLRFPGWWAVLPVAGSLALIAAGPEAIINRTILSRRVAVYVGLISYPLYLWHWPLISFAYIIRLGKMPTPLMSAGLLIATFPLAWLTYQFIERPIRFGKHRARTGIAIAGMVVVGTCGLAVWTANGFPGRFASLPGIDMRKISEAARDLAFVPTMGMDVLSYDGTIVAHLGKGDRKVALSGDSLLFQYGPRVQQLAEDGKLTANTWFVVGGNCAPLPGTIQVDDFAHCANMTGILTELIKREHIQSVVLGASWGGYGGGDILKVERNGRRYTLTPEGVDAFYANLEDFVRQLKDLGAQVYLVQGAPVNHAHFNPTKMITRRVTGFDIAPDVEKDVPTAKLRSDYVTIDDRLRGIAQRTDAKLLDPFPDVCGNGDGCSPFFADGDPKYSDGVHLRPSFVSQHIHFLDFLLK